MIAFFLCALFGTCTVQKLDWDYITYSQQWPTSFCQLNKCWTNKYNGAFRIHGLWSHEWNKHGRCAIELKKMSTELAYFNVSMAIHDRIGLDEIFKRNGIVPSHLVAYNTSAVSKILEKELNGRSNLMCWNYKKSNTKPLAEVRTCFNPELSVINCEARSSSETQHIREGKKRKYSIGPCPDWFILNE